MNNYTPKSIQLVKREMAWTHLLKTLDQYEKEVNKPMSRIAKIKLSHHVFFIKELRKILQSIEQQAEIEIVEHLKDKGFSDRQIERLLKRNDNVSFLGGSK